MNCQTNYIKVTQYVNLTSKANVEVNLHSFWWPAGGYSFFSRRRVTPVVLNKCNWIYDLSKHFSDGLIVIC